MHRPPLPPRKYSRYPFLFEAEYTQGHKAAGRIMSMKKVHYQATNMYLWKILNNTQPFYENKTKYIFTKFRKVLLFRR
jgi:hypothetical protein